VKTKHDRNILARMGRPIGLLFTMIGFILMFIVFKHPATGWKIAFLLTFGGGLLLTVIGQMAEDFADEAELAKRYS
jgi:4-hydroxybenzoate polyprenyltransferase